MTGCINTIKLIGSGTIGIYATQLYIQSNRFQNYKNDISVNDLSSKITELSRQVSINKLIQFTLCGVSSFIFWGIYNISDSSNKHPYLIYSCIGIPISFISILVNNYKSERTLGKDLDNLNKREIESRDRLKEREDKELDKSYIHISDENGSNSESNESIEDEVSSTLIRNETINQLDNITKGYVLGGYISGVTLLLSVIGVYGDLFL